MCGVGAPSSRERRPDAPKRSPQLDITVNTYVLSRYPNSWTKIKLPKFPTLFRLPAPGELTLGRIASG